MEKFITLNILVEFGCFLTALVCLLTDRSSWRTMLAYMAIVVTVETVGRQMALTGTSNSTLYNYYLPIEAAFISYMFYKLLQNNIWILWGLFLFIVSFLSEAWINGVKDFLYITNIISSALIVFYSLLYFYELLKDDAFYNLRSYAPFWWVSGTLSFYFGSTAVNIALKYLLQLSKAELGFDLRYYIMSVLILILYSCWSYSFVCRAREVLQGGTPVRNP